MFSVNFEIFINNVHYLQSSECGKLHLSVFKMQACALIHRVSLKSPADKINLLEIKENVLVLS